MDREKCRNRFLFKNAVRLAFLIAPAAVDATVLEFDQIRLSGETVPTISGNAVPQDYGDRVTGAVVDVSGGQFTYGNAGEGYTPNVLVEYFTGAATTINPGVSIWQTGYGDLTNLVFGNNNSLSLNVRLTADPGYQVQLYHFDLAGYPDADYVIDAVRVSDGTGPLMEQFDVAVEGDAVGPGHSAFDFAAPLTAAQLLIEIDYGNLAGSQQDNIGLDNLRFGQSPPAVVPLPSTGLLLGFGLAGLVGSLRRHGRVGLRRLR